MSHDQLVITAGVGLGLLVSLMVAAIMGFSRATERKAARQLAESNVALEVRVADLELQLSYAMERLQIKHSPRVGRRSSMRRRTA